MVHKYGPFCAHLALYNFGSEKKHSQTPNSPQTTMATFFKWFTLTVLALICIYIGMSIQEAHLTSGSGNASYSSGGGSSQEQRPYGIFRTNEAKPDPSSASCQTPTTTNRGKWQATIDGKLTEFTSLQDLNSHIEGNYGIKFRPLTLFERFKKWLGDLF